MAVDIGNSVKTGFSTGVKIIKQYCVPMALGAILVSIIVTAVPATKKFLQ